MIRLNAMIVKPTMFPDGTSQIWHLPNDWIRSRNVIRWDFENEAEFMHVAQLKTMLAGFGFEAELHIPFLPYGRQDKPISNEGTFALSTFAGLINSLEFSRVVTVDAHSDRFMQLIKNGVDQSAGVYFYRAFEDSGADCIGIPDRGAMRRYGPMMSNVPVIIGNKERDQATGHLKYTGAAGADVRGKSVLIVDDICDGGMTFILFAGLLMDLGVREISLYTTHGIYSKGTKVLREAGIRRIFNHKGEVH